LYHVPQFHVSTVVPRSTLHHWSTPHRCHPTYTIHSHIQYQLSSILQFFLHTRCFPTATTLYILFIVSHNRTSVQSFNSSCICAVFTPRHKPSIGGSTKCVAGPSADGLNYCEQRTCSKQHYLHIEKSYSTLTWKRSNYKTTLSAFISVYDLS
jgi:hypothetical protein